MYKVCGEVEERDSKDEVDADVVIVLDFKFKFSPQFKVSSSPEYGDERVAAVVDVVAVFVFSSL